MSPSQLRQKGGYDDLALQIRSANEKDRKRIFDALRGPFLHALKKSAAGGGHRPFANFHTMPSCDFRNFPLTCFPAPGDRLLVAPTHSQVRFPVDPRMVPAAKAARRLHLILPEFERVLPKLLARGFPRPDPDIGNFDLKAIDAWLDSQMAMQPGGVARNANEYWAQRLASGDVTVGRAGAMAIDESVEPSIRQAIFEARLKTLPKRGERRKR